MFHKRAYAVAYVVFMLFGLVCMTPLLQARAPMPIDPSPPKMSWKKTLGKLTSGPKLETIPEQPKQPPPFRILHHSWSFEKGSKKVNQ
ncbi:hypothetical protein DFH05DRAFT_1482403 [Lentinula detonsa]|uniref:Uncharacterized protein n=1 Tax=Lentinula detonsa TaxID=2804962 RepID=A0A9W8U0Z8_9AGAR|nr:hypothetical protein DFH05DRAFT_1482403 [Lentinula detonsa]